MSLSKSEVNLLVKKLRDKYTDFGERYSKAWFNRDAFEDRLRVSLDNKMNLEGFILAEIKNFEEIRERYDKKTKKSAFSEKVDKVITEITDKVKQYPSILFHPYAGFEISHFYGALSEFTQKYFPILRIVLNDAELKNRMHHFEDYFQDIAVPRGKNHPKRIEDHVMLLSREGTRELDIELDKNSYLKESAFLLHEVVDFCDDLIKKRDPDWESPITFARLYVEGQRKKDIIGLFENHTGYGAIVRVREYAAGIIDNFRLSAFRRKD